MKFWIVLLTLLFASFIHADNLVYEGQGGFGKGKHIVFIANKCAGQYVFPESLTILCPMHLADQKNETGQQQLLLREHEC